MARARLRNVAIRVREILSPLGGEVELICERRMEALEGRLIGKPDVVVKAHGAHWILDYKTGGVIDLETEEPRNEYVAQLQLYAVLEHARSGEWPTRGVLLPFAQRMVDIELDPITCKQLADQIAAVIEEFNDRAPEAQPPSPSTDNCQWCGHPAACAAVWESCDETWAPQVTMVQGVVAEAARSELGVVTIVLDVEGGTLPVSRIAILADPRLFAGLDEIEEGTQVRASGLRRRRGERTFSLAPWSTFEAGSW
jgi:hypothetical protein